MRIRIREKIGGKNLKGGLEKREKMVLNPTSVKLSSWKFISNQSATT